MNTEDPKHVYIPQMSKEHIYILIKSRGLTTTAPVPLNNRMCTFPPDQFHEWELVPGGGAPQWRIRVTKKGLPRVRRGYDPYQNAEDLEWDRWVNLYQPARTGGIPEEE